VLSEASRYPDLFEIARRAGSMFIRRNTAIIRPASTPTEPKTGSAALQAVADWAAKSEPHFGPAAMPDSTEQPTPANDPPSTIHDARSLVSSQAEAIALEIVCDKVRSICMTQFEPIRQATLPNGTRPKDADELQAELDIANQATFVLWWLEGLVRELAGAKG
jgi:hypothetical protein